MDDTGEDMRDGAVPHGRLNTLYTETGRERPLVSGEQGAAPIQRAAPRVW